jgi:hypothetical protein
MAMRSPTRALVPVVLVLAALFAPAASASEPKPPSVIPPEVGKIDGRTYAEWSAEWWRQGYAVPKARSPFLEEGRANCGLGSRNVRFLFGTFATTGDAPADVVGVANRSCTIRAHTRLFLPSLNGDCSTAGGDGKTEAELRACATTQGDFIAGGERSLTVDGVTLPTYRVASPLFTVSFPRDNILGVEPQRSLSVADGFFAMLDGLEPRRKPYVVAFGGSLRIPASSTSAAFTFRTTVTYAITVRDD